MYTDIIPIVRMSYRKGDSRMERKITFAQYGCGNEWQSIVRYAIEKGAELVAAFDINPAVLGKDASEIVAEDYPKTGVAFLPQRRQRKSWAL